MPLVCFSESDFYFPPLHAADDEGLLVIGGQVTPERVLEAYPKGIFPWYSDDIPLWWSPDPRFVLFPADLHISRSMQKVLQKGNFEFCTNTSFSAVIEACATVPRHGQDGTWITPEMQEVYTELHRRGFAHSAETWQDGKL
ncbi:MAG: leucyl/phenylalanyl-tRNA--protein transferase, partial [Chitinophagaceae bacterium]